MANNNKQTKQNKIIITRRTNKIKQTNKQNNQKKKKKKIKQSNKQTDKSTHISDNNSQQ